MICLGNESFYMLGQIVPPYAIAPERPEAAAFVGFKNKGLCYNKTTDNLEMYTN